MLKVLKETHNTLQGLFAMYVEGVKKVQNTLLRL